MNRRLILVAGCVFSVATLSLHAAVGDQYLASVRADAIYFDKATNQLGSIEISNRGNGASYSFLIVLNAGGIVQDSFFYEGGPITYLELPKVSKDVQWSPTIGFGQFGQTRGTITFTRKAGFAIGDFQLSGTQIGTVTGKFYVVDFRGILTEGQFGVLSGTMSQEYPHPGVPERLLLGPGSNDDAIGTDAGRNYTTSFSSEFLITENPSGIKQWTWFRGSAVKLGQNIGQTGDFIIEIQSTDSIGAIWQSLGSIPISPDKPSELFRLKITRK